MVRQVGPGGFRLTRQMLQQQVDRLAPFDSTDPLHHRSLARQHFGTAKIRRRLNLDPCRQYAGQGRGPNRCGGQLLHFCCDGRRRHRPVTDLKAQPARGQIAADPRHPLDSNAIPACRVRYFACTRDDQPGPRPRHRHIQQPQAFLRIPRHLPLSQSLNLRWTAGGGGLPHRPFRLVHIEMIAVWRLVVGGVRQDHDLGLQPLGTMHRHHPDPLPRGFGLPLDLDLIGIQPDQESGQARHVVAFIGQRLVQQLVNRLLGLFAQPRDKATAAIMADQDPFQQIIGAQKVDLPAHIGQKCRNRLEFRALGPQTFPQISRAAIGQIEQFRLAYPAERRAQNGGQRQIVVWRVQKRQQRQQVIDRQFRRQFQPVRPGNRQTLLLAGPDDMAEQTRRTALHQNQEITGMNRARPFTRHDGRAGIQHSPYVGGNLVGQPGKMVR